MVAPLLDVTELSCRRGGRAVFERLSFGLGAGEVLALVGRNGSGKTTLLRSLALLVRPAAGRIAWQGADVARDPETWRSRLAWLGHLDGLKADLTVHENLVAATYALTGVRPSQADFGLVYEYFPRLAERRAQRAGYLSGGEQQMLAIGRALLGKPTLMLLDEPSLGLAPMVVEGIFEIIARINREQGVAMLLVEQNAMAAFGIAQYGYIMESGKVVIDGPTAKLVNDADVQRFYLGYGDGSEELASFRHVKHYKRRKRWLS